MALAILFLAALSGPGAGVARAGTEPPIEERLGSGPWRMRLACIGCVGLWVYVGSANPALMIYHAVRNPPLIEGCAVACLEAIT